MVRCQGCPKQLWLVYPVNNRRPKRLRHRETRRLRPRGRLVHRRGWPPGELRTRLTTSPKAAAVTLMSSSEVSRPNEKRTNPAASLGDAPSAASTCEGVSEPAEQAEPLEAQTPAKSRPANSDKLSQPSAVNARVLARRPTGAEPQRRTPGSAAVVRDSSRSVKGRRRCGSNTGGFVKRTSAATKPAMAATFSVPGRRSSS